MSGLDLTSRSDGLLAYPIAFTKRRYRRGDVFALLVALLAAIALGFVLSRSIAIAILLVGGVALIGASAVLGRLVLAQVALASLPWFIVFADLMPPLVKTFTSAGAVLTVLLLVSPIRFRNSAVLAGVFLFLSSVLIGTVTATEGAQFIQAAKYLLFPVMAIAVVSERAPAEMPKVKRVVLGSGILAVATHIVVILLGAGAIGTYYGAGERLGFDASSPHNLALLSMIVAAAGLISAKRDGARLAYLCLGTIPAIASGVRSALIAVIVVLFIFVLQSRFKLRSVVAVGGAALIILASGALGIVETRYRLDRSRGEFASFNTAGSGRGAVWSIALRHWANSGPVGWLRGTGLRSITKIEEQQVGSAVVGHSDVIEVGVQLGLVGFVGWLLIWFGLLRARLRGLVLVPIAVYAVFNGGIEYVDSLVFGLALAAACTTESSKSTLDTSLIRRRTHTSSSPSLYPAR